MSNLESPLISEQVEQLQQYQNPVVVALNGPNVRQEPTVLSADTMARNNHAGALAIVGGFDVLCVGGEAETNRQWILEHFGRHLGRVSVYADSLSRDTVGNAISTSRFADRNDSDGVGLVTLPYHLPRALYCFETVLGSGVNVTPCAPEDTVHGTGRKAYLRAAQLPIALLNRWQLRGFDPYRGEALDYLEARLMSSSPRYEEQSAGPLGRLLHVLDRATSSRR